MARFRLRFLLHEFDLPSDEVYIGRGAVCGLTVDDPLVSRKHARLFIRAGEAWIEDLSSRNGVRVDGRVINSPTVLHDGAHLRIGTQEMSLRRLEDERVRPVRKVATGFLVHCSGCGRPYGSAEKVCPHCGQEVLSKPAQVAQVSSAESAWSMELLVETMSRAASLGRTADTERLLKQARSALDTIGNQVERRRLDQFASAAMDLAVQTDSVDWATWALQIFVDRGILPRPEMSQRLSELPPSSRDSIIPQVDELLKVPASPGSLEDVDSESRLALLSFHPRSESFPPDTRDERDRLSDTNKDHGSESR